MREYDYVKDYGKLLTPETVNLLSQIHEFKGGQNWFIETHSDTLAQLLDIAKIQSTEASNRIENICTSDERLKKIVLDVRRAMDHLHRNGGRLYRNHAGVPARLYLLRPERKGGRRCAGHRRNGSRKNSRLGGNGGSLSAGTRRLIRE